MGLFGKGKKHRVTEAEWTTLVTEMTIVRARLEAAEQAKTRLEDQLRALDATTASLADDRTRLETVELRARVVGLEDHLTTVAEQAAKAELAAEVAERVAEQVEQVAEQVEQVVERTEAAGQQASAAAPVDTSAIESRVADIAGQLGQFAERLSGTDASVRGMNEQLVLVQHRLTAISTELANQITELSGDIDALARLGEQSSGAAVSDEVIDTLRNAQVKLAAEQARYEIAFRQDLAVLAERLGQRRS